MKVAPPRVYSSVELRNMLVPKTYGIKRVVRSIVANHSHPSPSSTDVASTKSSHAGFGGATVEQRNADRRTGTTGADGGGATVGVRRADADEIVSEIDALSLGETEADDVLRGGVVMVIDERAADRERRPMITKTDIAADVTKTERGVNVPADDSGYVSSNDGRSVNGGQPTVENCVFYDYDNQEPEYVEYVNDSAKASSLLSIEHVDDVKFIKTCRNCRKVWPLDDFSWEKISEADRVQLKNLIERTILNADEEAVTTSGSKISI